MPSRCKRSSGTNQATDRAFRIGQRKNVLVHKFVCRGTIEERIDDLIESKKSLAKEVVEGGGDMLVTEMSDDQLLQMVALDINNSNCKYHFYSFAGHSIFFA